MTVRVRGQKGHTYAEKAASSSGLKPAREGAGYITGEDNTEERATAGTGVDVVEAGTAGSLIRSRHSCPTAPSLRLYQIIW